MIRDWHGWVCPVTNRGRAQTEVDLPHWLLRLPNSHAGWHKLRLPVCVLDEVEKRAYGPIPIVCPLDTNGLKRDRGANGPRPQVDRSI